MNDSHLILGVDIGGTSIKAAVVDTRVLLAHRVEPGDDMSGSDHNPFFVRGRDGRFHDVAPQLGLDLRRRQTLFAIQRCVDPGFFLFDLLGIQRGKCGVLVVEGFVARIDNLP